MSIRVCDSFTHCAFPVEMDTYEGCQHNCGYCFARKFKTGRDAAIRPIYQEKSIREWAAGKRTARTEAFGWNIPIRWGALSDPFQPCETTYRATRKALEVFRELKYPFIVTTKGRLAGSPEYVELLSGCRCAVFISACCPKYDDFELAAAPFSVRIETMRRLSSAGVSVYVRCQPYIPELFAEIADSFAAFGNAGAKGVVVERMRDYRLVKGTLEAARTGGDYVDPAKLMHMREKAHAAGLKFVSTDYMTLSDSRNCCLWEGGEPLRFQMSYMEGKAPEDYPEPQRSLKKPGSAEALRGIHRTAEWKDSIRGKSYAEIMARLARTR